MAEVVQAETATPAPINTTTVAPELVVTENTALVVETILGLIGAVALLILVTVQLVVRSRLRSNRLQTMRTRTRLDSKYYLSHSRWDDDPRKLIMQQSVVAFDKRIATPIQHHTRVIPAVNPQGKKGSETDRDGRRDCRMYLERVRQGLPPRLQRCTMRTAVAYLRDMGMAGSRADSERFLDVYESVLLGVHKGDGTCGDVTQEELGRMRKYFHGVIAKALA